MLTPPPSPVSHLLRATAASVATAIALLAPLPAATPGGGAELVGIALDKWIHALLFLLLARLWLRWAVIALPGRPRWRTATLLVLALGAWGGLLELAQSALGWRTGEWSDLAADLTGALLGTLLSTLLNSPSPLQSPELR